MQRNHRIQTNAGKKGGKRLMLLIAVIFVVVVIAALRAATNVHDDTHLSQSEVTNLKNHIDVLQNAIKATNPPIDITSPLEGILQDIGVGTTITRARYESASPQRLAVEWLALDDNFLNTSESKSSDVLLQRYALATLYFATHGDEWKFCSRIRKADASNNHIDTITSSPCMTGTTRGERYLSAGPVTKWSGIHRNGAQVAMIDLTDMGLRGSSSPGSGVIPNELLLTAPSLEGLWLSLNPNLGGTLPSWIGLMSKMKSMSFHDTGLTGSIPESFAQITKLESLRLYNNKLTGTLSKNFITGSKEKLAWLWLHGNELDGKIPDSFAQLTKLEALTLHGNNFENRLSFPKKICRMKESSQVLEHLWTDCIVKPSNKGDGESDVTCNCCTRCFLRKTSVDVK